MNFVLLWLLESHIVNMLLLTFFQIILLTQPCVCALSFLCMSLLGYWCMIVESRVRLFKSR